ncbi:hypothetical protein Ancab_038863 [Ancistrocladus abbreviatus]
MEERSIKLGTKKGREAIKVVQNVELIKDKLDKWKWVQDSSSLYCIKKAYEQLNQKDGNGVKLILLKSWNNWVFLKGTQRSNGSDLFNRSTSISSTYDYDKDEVT